MKRTILVVLVVGAGVVLLINYLVRLARLFASFLLLSN